LQFVNEFRELDVGGYGKMAPVSIFGLPRPVDFSFETGRNLEAINKWREHTKSLASWEPPTNLPPIINESNLIKTMNFIEFQYVPRGNTESLAVKALQKGEGSFKAAVAFLEIADVLGDDHE